MAQWRARAEQALREGRIDDGIAGYRAWLALSPDDAEGWYNLGYLHRCARAFRPALEAYDRAIRAGIARAEEVHLNRAVILAEFLESPAAAEAELRRALAIAPAFVPAWLNLGLLCEDAGQPGEARDAYARALRYDPGNARALARTAAIDLFEGHAAASIPALRDAMRRLDPHGAAAAEIGFALGAALDAEGDYDAAFAAFSAANRAARAARPPAYRYRPAAQERLVDALIAADPMAVPGGDEDPSAPLFICGMFRSGSTLIEQMLSRHSRVTRGGELEIVPAFAAELAAAGWPGPLAAATVAALRARYRDEVRALHGDYDRLTDKRPDNFLYVGLIKRLFPRALVIATERDPRDTGLSIFFNHFDDSVTYGNDLADIAHWLRQYRRLTAHWQSLYPDDIHVLDYDALVRDPEPAIRGTLTFAGLAYEPDVLAPERATGAVRTASVWQVRRPLHGGSSGRWRHYARHLGPLAALA